MAVPTDKDDLSLVSSENPPTGTESTFPNLDNYLRVIFTFIAELRDEIAAVDAGTGYAELAGAQFIGPVSVAFVTLTDSETITPNALLGNNFIVTLGANRVMANPTGLRDGGVYRFWIKQDATGGRTLSFGSFFKFAGGVAPTLSTGAAKLDVIEGQYNAALAILHCKTTLDVR
jgi:hypothetical protein